MNILKTKILFEHQALIRIFFDANNMESVDVLEYVDPDQYGNQTMISIFYEDEFSGQLSFMALRHAGIPNMLDHYLLKCGVSPFNLHATEIMNIKEAMDIALKGTI